MQVETWYLVVWVVIHAFGGGEEGGGTLPRYSIYLPSNCCPYLPYIGKDWIEFTVPRLTVVDRETSW